MNFDSYSPQDLKLIREYRAKLDKDPSSRIFAPLAEAYRRAGMIEEAVQTAREGLQVHPNYVSGKVALARALFDKKHYTEVIDQLSSVVRDNPENLIALRLISESYLILGKNIQALETYKLLLAFAPNDSEVASLVQELEEQAYSENWLQIQSSQSQSPDHYIEQKTSKIMDHDLFLEKRNFEKKISFLTDLLVKIGRYRSSEV